MTPIRQLVAGWKPGFHNSYVNLALAVPLTVGFAALSWAAVERPALSLRRYVPWLDVLSCLTARFVAPLKGSRV